MKKEIILYIDGDRLLQAQLSKTLENKEYKVISAVSAFEALNKLSYIDVDTILLANNLPDIEYKSLIPEIQSITDAKIIVISNEYDTVEKIKFFEMDIDDYIAKPFDMDTLSKKVETVTNRSQKNTKHNEEIFILRNGWIFNKEKSQLFDNDQQIVSLSAGELRLLESLVIHPDQVLSREKIFNLTRNGVFKESDRAIDIQVTRLRKKLCDDQKNPYLIKTIRGIGYLYSTQ